MSANRVTSLAIALNGRAIATANGQSVKLWSREDGVLIRDLAEQTAGASRVSVTEDASTLIAARRDGKIVALADPFAPALAVQFAPNEVAVAATGVALQTFSMQTSANLLDWNVLTNYTGNQSVTAFRFSFAPGDPSRFWRLHSN